MEPAKMDWNSLESVFVIDNVYENINAPQWIDFLNPDAHLHDNHSDHSWFCRPDCKHPKTAEDFLKSTPTSKLLRSVSVSKLIDWSWRRDMNLKRRGQGQCSDDDDDADENHNSNSNYSTPIRPPLNPAKAAIKSSAEKIDYKQNEEENEYSDILLRNEEDRVRPKLKSSQSARDLFGGRDFFGKITEFCNDLKKIVTAKDREEDQQENKSNSKFMSSSSETEKTPNSKSVNEKKGGRVVLGERVLDEKEKERKPLLEVSTKDKSITTPPKPKLRRNKRGDEAENIPIALNVKDIMKHKEEERILMPIRTNPPTPQGFSATRDSTKTTPSKGPKSRLMEKEILQELESSKTLKEEPGDMSHTKNASLIAGKEGKALDVFWFLKPCTL